MAESRKALSLTLRKLKPLAPPFHEHIARSKLRGGLWRVGDRVVVYEITATEPEGEVEFDEQTALIFE